MGLTVGIDAGSAAVKAVAMEAGLPLAWRKEPTSPDLRAQSSRMLGELMLSVDANARQQAHVCSTGYGRYLVDSASEQVSEILANALGAGWMWRHWNRLEGTFGEPPEPASPPSPFRTIIDVGGQDSKVITLSSDGIVEQFAMNDRCAAGTGRFLEVMSRVLEEDLPGMDAMAARAERHAPMSSTCTVFAESEVISLLSEGRDKAEVAAGLFQSVARRTAELAAQVGWSPPVLLDGGPSRCRSLRRAIERALGCPVAVPACPEFTTALGAAVFAAEAGGVPRTRPGGQGAR